MFLLFSFLLHFSSLSSFSAKTKKNFKSVAGFFHLKSACFSAQPQQAATASGCRGKSCLAACTLFPMWCRGEQALFPNPKAGTATLTPLSSLSEGAEPGWHNLPDILKRARRKQIFAMVFGTDAHQAAQRLVTDTRIHLHNTKADCSVTHG